MRAKSELHFCKYVLQTGWTKIGSVISVIILSLRVNSSLIFTDHISTVCSVVWYVDKLNLTDIVKQLITQSRSFLDHLYQSFSALYCVLNIKPVDNKQRTIAKIINNFTFHPDTLGLVAGVWIAGIWAICWGGFWGKSLWAGDSAPKSEQDVPGTWKPFAT